MTALHQILVPDAKIWAHPSWGTIDPRERVRGFGKEKVARRLESEGQYDRDMILNIGVGTPKRDLPRVLTGRLLDISTFVPKVMRTEDIIGTEQYRRWVEERGRWWQRGYQSAWIIGAVCPARDTGVALVMTRLDTAAMNLFLAELGQAVAPGAHGIQARDNLVGHALIKVRFHWLSPSPSGLRLLLPD